MMIRKSSSLFGLPINHSVFRALASNATKSLKEGDRVPDVVFKSRVRDDTIKSENPFKWKDVSSRDLFAKKRVVLFALPGGESLNVVIF